MQGILTDSLMLRHYIRARGGRVSPGADGSDSKRGFKKLMLPGHCLPSNMTL
jgi:hypothetical protein